MEIFLDDFCVYDNKEDHPKHLARCFAQCAKYGISFNVAKFQFVVPFGKLLGHIVRAKGIEHDPVKIGLIVNFPRPTIVRRVCSFVGLASYYRRAIRSFAEIATPLIHLFKKLEVGAHLVWESA